MVRVDLPGASVKFATKEGPMLRCLRAQPAWFIENCTLKKQARIELEFDARLA